MKLIIREYLGSLRERGELDAILPDLLSQMGLNVYSRPARGTRQDGVDVGAVGSLNGGTEIGSPRLFNRAFFARTSCPPELVRSFERLLHCSMNRKRRIGTLLLFLGSFRIRQRAKALIVYEQFDRSVFVYGFCSPGREK